MPAKKKTKADNVTPIKPPAEADRHATGARCFAAVQALTAVKDLLVERDKELSGAETKTKTEATQAYRKLLREEDPKTQRRASELFHETKAGLAHMDEVAEANREAKSARKAKINEVQAAITETIAVDDASANPQGDLFGGAKVDGLGWASDGTRKAIFAALTELDDRDSLNLEQQRMFEDMARAGMAGIDLGLDVAGAIEVDDEDLNEPEANDAALDPDQVPF